MGDVPGVRDLAAGKQGDDSRFVPIGVAELFVRVQPYDALVADHARLAQPDFERKRLVAGRPAAASVLSSAGSVAGSPTNGVGWSLTFRALHVSVR